MDFIANSKHQIEEMLQAIGVPSIDDLFSAIPDQIKLPPPKTDDGLSEFEGLQLMERLGEKNLFRNYDSYIGAGAYEHHIPAIVASICSKSEFLTAYTPYQAEASQGLLQSIFEYQSAICALTAMDVSNASVYDAASACAEGALMALRTKKKRKKIVIDKGVHPHYQEVVNLYLGHEEFSTCNGKVDEETAALLIQHPNFYGEVEDLKELIEDTHEKGALVIVCGHLLSCGLFQSPGELGADIAVGSTQAFGVPLNFGGPYVGYVACKESLVRQLPGRLIGETVDTKGRRGFVLTLQAREQHIRREKATSNICSNQALAALASLIAILWYGKEGVKKLALTNFQRAEYLKQELAKLPQTTLFSEKTTFNEFAIHFGAPAEKVEAHFKNANILPGHPIEKDYFLVCATETKSKEQIDRYIACAKEIAS